MKIPVKLSAFLLLAIAITMGFSSCTKTKYYDRVGEIENPNKAFVVTLKPSNWERVSNALIRYDIPLQDLTDYYILQGGVAVALSFDGDERAYSVLPATFDGLAYSVDYAEGWVTITIDDPLADDSINVTIPEDDIQAKIILTTTDYFDYRGFFKPEFKGFQFKPIN